MNDLFGYKPPPEPPKKPVTLGRVNGFWIEANRPIATDRQSVARKKWDSSKFPFADLAVGQCFVVDVPEGEEPIYTQNTVSGAASTYARRFAKDNPNAIAKLFTTRQQGRVVRCWRTQ